MAGKLMHAVRFDSFGGGVPGLKHVDVPVPVPKKDEVLLRLDATSLNPIDWKIQEGQLRLILPHKFPYIPGEVVEVSADVKKFMVGDKVVAMLRHSGFRSPTICGVVIRCLKSCVSLMEMRELKLMPAPRALMNQLTGGGLAEFAVAPESLIVKRPPEVSAVEAAGLPVAALTAHQALTKYAGIKLDGSGKTTNVLITAASGGVGHYAVQLAKLGNTHVTATCGARNIDFVKSLGADEVLDYKTPEGAALKSPSGRKYDAVIHCALGIPWSTFEPNLSECGKLIDITPGPRALMTYVFNKVTFFKKQLVPMVLIPKAEDLEYMLKLVKDGKLKTVVDSKHPLSNVEEAWSKGIAGHATGKLIVEF
ncbi:hypothetical protein IFM89_030553 [Coptis chinensis]|uniref:Enoyl reductase (ER) domain-containing protein n=1 Tax=Coptis chinensis TaxID=261450 RepID=A0A835LPI7_9MAGN|nr:hypothetical protein IFM89_030553 [Coptis chinensis]